MPYNARRTLTTLHTCSHELEYRAWRGLVRENHVCTLFALITRSRKRIISNYDVKHIYMAPSINIVMTLRKYMNHGWFIPCTSRETLLVRFFWIPYVMFLASEDVKISLSHPFLSHIEFFQVPFV